MKIFLLLVELFCYVFAFYVFFKKKELAILYIPVLNFADTIIEPVLPKFAYAAVVTLLLLSVIWKNLDFYRRNIFSLIITVYFLVLLTQSTTNPEIKWPHIFSVLWLFTIIPLIGTIYRKYTRDVIFKEVSNAAFFLLCLFVANTLMSTIFKFSPFAMYHITSGILYGNLYAAGFNSLSVAIFIVLLRVINERNVWHFLVFILSFGFVMLSLRRSVMGLSAFGIVVAVAAMMTQAKVKMLIGFVSVMVVIGYLVYLKTDFLSEFNERVELRQLDERSLDEEQRLFEYELLYNDMFVYDRYSPWFGFELFNSPGNYGGGVFYDRSLHGDLTSIAHSSGIVGVLLYLAMVFTAFKQSFRASRRTSDKLIIAFGGAAFFTFTGTGRYTELTTFILVFLIISLPLCKEAIIEDEVPEEVQELELLEA